MTRKDYELFAAALHDARPMKESIHHDVLQSRWQHTCRVVADRLAVDNARFDRCRFLRACAMGG